MNPQIREPERLAEGVEVERVLASDFRRSAADCVEK
jgi:hypothetical protein